MAKRYFVSFKTLTQAERMADKLYSEADKLYWNLMDLDGEEYQEVSNRMKALNKRVTELRHALHQVDGERKAEWKYIEILKLAENERSFMDSLL